MPHMSAARAATKAGKVTFVNYMLFPTAPIVIGSHHYIFVFFYLNNRCCLKWTEASTFPQTTLRPLIVTLSWPLTQLA